MILNNTDYELETVIDTITDLAQECFDISISHGFHEDSAVIRELIAQDLPSLLPWYEATVHQAEIARIHSELSEGLESVRKDPLAVDQHIPRFSNVAVEYADAIIRILDTCAKRGIPIGTALLAKMEYNRSRPFKHGKNS